MKRINDCFPELYRRKTIITSLDPLQFETPIFKRNDVIKCTISDSYYLLRGKTYPYETIDRYIKIIQNGSTHSLQIGDEVYYVGDFIKSDSDTISDTILIDLLNRKNYYHVCDLLYDLSLNFEEIPDALFRYVLQVTNGYESDSNI